MGLLTGLTDEGVNFADVEASTGPDFDALPAGWYHMAITDASDHKDNGEPRITAADSPKYPNVAMLNVEFTVQSGDKAKRKFWQNYLLHPDFAENLKALCVAVFGDKANEEGFDFDAEDLEGAELDVKLGRWKSKKGRNKGEYVNGINGFAEAGTRSAEGSSEESGSNPLMP